MRRSFPIVYAIATAIISLVLLLIQTKPVIILMQIFEVPGDKNSYYITPVFMITWMALLMPFFIYMIIARLLRMKDDGIITSDRTGIFVSRKKAFQSGLVGIPIYVNDKKVGLIDNGKTKFFDLNPGKHTIQAGMGKQGSEILHINIIEGQQIKFEMEILSLGLGLKYDLKQI